MTAGAVCFTAESCRPIRVGCAGWSILKEHVGQFPGQGTHLERYAARFPAVEINSSFYRPHRPATYARWAASVPAHFRFAVKVPRDITHRCRLANVTDLLERFHAECSALGDKLGPLLVQLPPSLAYDAAIAASFFAAVRERFGGAVVCEPRHPSWFVPAVEDCLKEFRVARVAADPTVVPAAGEPGGWPGLAYYRLHGAPHVYYSAYSADYVATLANRLKALAVTREVWCIFDNTARGAAAVNALTALEQTRNR